MFQDQVLAHSEKNLQSQLRFNSTKNSFSMYIHIPFLVFLYTVQTPNLYRYTSNFSTIKNLRSLDICLSFLVHMHLLSKYKYLVV